MPELTLRGGDVDGLGLHYEVAGRGPAVVLVHGLGGFGASWRHTIDALASRATVYAVDLPGFGRSGKPRTHYRLGYFALAHPSRVERLAIVAGLVPGFSFHMSLGYRVITIPLVGEALALCGRAPVYKAAIARCFHTPRRSEVDFLVDHDYAERTAPEAKAAWLATARHIRADFVTHRGDYRRAIATLDLPVLVVHGRQDPAVPPLHATEVTAGFPHAGLRWVDACGHFPHLEHAAVVIGWLAEFLVGRPAPR